MSIFRSVIVGAALLVGSTMTTSAADLYGGSIKDGYVPAYTQSGPASWYLRLDGGYVSFEDPALTESHRFDFHNTGIDSTWSLGAGLGYYFSRSVRGDLTWDHRFEADVTGTAGSNAGIVPNGTRTFGISSDVVLANIYYDFNRAGRINPYIGAGLGFAYHKTSTGSINDPCGGGCTGVVESGTDWSVAGALMTGVSFNIRDRMHLDAGYRYLYMGDAKTGLVTGTCPGACTPGEITMKDLASHEFRLGLRYDIR